MQEEKPVKFGERDLLYGRDTDGKKVRTQFRKYVRGQTASTPTPVWDQHNNDSTLKVDILTQSMGPNPPEPTHIKVGNRSWQPKNTRPNLDGALPGNWQTNTGIGPRFQMRAEDKQEFMKWISQHPRYNPDLSAKPHEWNQRFKRTSKAGLEWTLKEKGRNVHFIVPKGQQYDDVVQGSKSVPGHQAYMARYLPSEDSDVSPEIEEKIITHAEMRWLFRNRNDPNVHSNVQFWESDFSDETGQIEFKPIEPPWVTHPEVFQRYGESVNAKQAARAEPKLNAHATPSAEATPFRAVGGKLLPAL